MTLSFSLHLLQCHAIIAAVIATVLSPFTASAASVLNQEIVSELSSDERFPLVTREDASPILCDSNDWLGVTRAAGDLQADIERVSGKRPAFLTSGGEAKHLVIVGTVGKSEVIANLVQAGKLDVSDLEGKWEAFVITSVDNPQPGVDRALIIAGSDKRGTIYGVYELSEQLGVSPWYWWADVPPKRRDEAHVLPGRFYSGEPAVRYRGIFINDEAPCFTGWAREKFGGLNSAMYAHMFELLLRLRANYLWPAMWGNAFNEDDPGNPRLADEYGIVMGTSHHEPMMRSQKEWNSHRREYGNGEWNYKSNAEGLREFWKDGLVRNKDYEQIVTMAMRGDGDLPMTDAGSAEENFRLIEQIMLDQREIISEATGLRPEEVPQIWALYSEVLDYYDQGIDVPDDMTILLCDENWGNVRRLPELGGERHPGGYGIYYHVDLHGAPRAYQWLNMTQIPHMWEQLQLTYSYGVDRVWILNVGDLKPNEYPMDFFLAMAWNPTAFTAGNLEQYAVDFCADKFGKAEAVEAAEILSTYCKYASRITAEMLDQRTYDLGTGEFLQVRDAFLALEAKAMRQYYQLPESARDAYMQLVLHPVRAMSNLYDMYYALAMNQKLASELDLGANYWADYALACFDRDAAFTQDFHENVSAGKWNHIMEQTHIGYRSWDEPRGGNVRPRVRRVSPQEARVGGYVFAERSGVVAMEGEHFYESQASGGTRWTVIPDLGRTLSGIALMPYTESTGDAFLSYRMRLDSRPESVRVRLYFDSTMPFKDGGHRIATSFDGGAEVEVNINADLTWANNYSRMYPAGAARMIEKAVELQLPGNAKPHQTLKIRPLDPGVVIYKVVVDTGGYQETHLKLPESPYTRE